MKPFSKTIITLMVCGLLFSGCATRRNLISKGTYKKDVTSSPQVAFSRIWAVEDGDAFKVSGELKRTGVVVDIPNHVQIELVNQEGEVIDKKKVDYYPTSLTGVRGRREARFSAEFDTSPPIGAAIRVSLVD